MLFGTKSSSLIIKGGLKIEGCKIEGLLYTYTVKLVLRDHCHERPPVLRDHTLMANGTVCTVHTADIVFTLAWTKAYAVIWGAAKLIIYKVHS